MKNDVSRQAAATLSTIDRELRRAEDLHWTDPGFLEWERGQVDDETLSWHTDDGLTRTVYAPGPAHWLTGNDAGLETDDTVRVSPIIDLYNDHPWCACDTDPAAAVDPTLRRWMLMTAADYPPPEQTTHGPLLLGPEPAVVGDDRGEWRGVIDDLAISDEALALYAGDAEALAQRYRTEDGGAR